MKRKITAIALAVCILVVGVIGATTAYFTDKKEATNTFTFGEGVKITLTENGQGGTAEANDKYELDAGTVVHNAEKVDDVVPTASTVGLKYENVIPGRYYAKAPQVELENSGKSDPAYIVVTATYKADRPFNFGGQATVKDLLGETGTGNVAVTRETIGNTEFFYFTAPVQPGTVVTPFQWVQLDPSVNNQDTSFVSETNIDADIEINAFAVLAANFNDCKTAFEAAFGNDATFDGILGENKSVMDTADAAGAATFTLDTAPVSQKQTTVALTGLTANAKYTLDATTYDAETATVPSTFTVTAGDGVIAALDLNLTDAEGQKALFADGEATVVTYIAKGIDKESLNVMYTGTDGADQPTAVTYDKDTGKLTFKTKHFSNFAVLVSEAAYNKTTNTAYETLAKAIEKVENGQTIVLTKNVANANGISVASGKNFTVDFNGYTYSVEKPGAGSAGTTTQAFQLLENSTITFKNGTINCTADNAGSTWQKDDTIKGVAMVIQNYCNLTLDNMTIDGTNIAHNGNNVRYVLSNNCGNVLYDSCTIIAADGDFAFDSCKYGTYTVPTVNVTGSTIKGKVEATGGHINFKAGTTVNGMVRVGENKDGTAVKDSVVTIEKGAKVINNNYVAVFGANTLNIYGEVDGCVCTNGNAYNAGSIINIYDGAVVTNNNAALEYGDAVYMPNGTLNISGGTITGKTAVYFKSTVLNIEGGTFIGNGEKKVYDYNGNGGKATGDALVVDSCNYPSGITGVTVSDGTFKSTNGNGVAAYTSQDATAVVKFISGGKFSSNPDATYLADGYNAELVSGYWTVTAAEN